MSPVPAPSTPDPNIAALSPHVTNRLFFGPSDRGRRPTSFAVDLRPVMMVCCDITGIHHHNVLHDLRFREVVYTRRLIAITARHYGYTGEMIAPYIGAQHRSQVFRLLRSTPPADMAPLWRDMQRAMKRLTRYAVSGVVV